MAIDLSKIDFSNGNYPYISPVPEQFPIVASSPCPFYRYSTQLDFRILRECGFNVAMDSPTKWPALNENDLVSGEIYNRLRKAEKNLRNGAEAGVRLMVHNYYFSYDLDSQNSGKEFVNLIKDNGNLGGWDLWDEPKENDMETVEKWNEYLHDVTPDKLVYVNILPELVAKEFPEEFAKPDNEGKYPEPKKFIQSFQNALRPALWCYDLYPMRYKGGEIVFRETGFYKFLETFRELSRLSCRPFWAFCQSAYFEKASLSRPRAAEAFLRFEAFSALAYGAQGIVYWRYYPGGNTEGTTYISALLDKEGRKTPQWYAAQKVNSEISRFTHIFLDCEIISCIHRGKPVINGITQNVEQGKNTFLPLHSIDYNGTGVILSHIRKDGYHYLLVVSHDPLSPQNLQLAFLRPFPILDLTPMSVGNCKIPNASIDENMEVNGNKDNESPLSLYRTVLSPGGYLLFKFDFK